MQNAIEVKIYSFIWIERNGKCVIKCWFVGWIIQKFWIIVLHISMAIL